MAEPGAESSEPGGAWDPGPHADDLRRLRDELDAERAGAAHWRDVARHREATLAELKQRTSVRALLSIERRTAAVRRAARRAGAAGWREVGALSMAASAIPATVDAPARRRRLHDLVATIDRTTARDGAAATGSTRSMVVVVVGATEAPPWLAALTGDGVRLVAAPDDGAVAAIVAAAHEDLLGIAAATTEPLTARPITRLAGSIDHPVVAATGVLVHPERARRLATPHDLLVRSAGLGAHVDPDGTPHLVARSAGARPGLPAASTTTGPSPVVATSGALALFDRDAVHSAGGYVDLGSLEASVIDLCLRLGRDGGQVVCVPDVLVADHRPVARSIDLLHPVDESSAQWRTLLERHGPRIRRAAPGVDRDARDLVLTVASPMRKVAHRWGDWHLAEALARALSDRGHRVHVQTLDEVTSPRSRGADVHLVLRGLSRVTRTPGQAHVLWIISHPEDLDQEELDAADLVLVASARFAAALRERTATPVETMLQATDIERFRPVPTDPIHRHEVTVVGKSRDVLRPMVRDAIAAGLRPAIYGSGWEHLVDPTLVIADHVDNADLPGVYSSAGVVLNDHWDTMRTRGFISNRVFDVLACGTPVVSDPVPGLDDAVGDLVPTWTTPDELRAAVSAALGIDRAAFAERARALITARHTFAHRAVELEHALDTLLPPTDPGRSRPS